MDLHGYELKIYDYHFIAKQEAPVFISDLRPGLHDVGLLFMPDRFYGSDTENSEEFDQIVGAERIRFLSSRITPIRHEKESCTWVIRYRVDRVSVSFL